MPETIGRYRIIEQIGKGAMAIVYKAHDPHINRLLAIKILRKERCIDSEYRKRFLRESRAAGNLSHPNIVTIYDIGEHHEQPYIAMELLPGTPLDAILKSEKKLTNQQINSISLQLADALDYAHSSGVIHRDIKPSNIVCSMKNDNYVQLKITDFGIAHIEDANLTQQTQLGDMLGTPLYMSPEQIRGKKIDGRSDLFSLGVILYQLYTDKKPFSGSTITTVFHNISSEDPPSINSLIDDFPVNLSAIIHRLLKKNPDERFQTGRELFLAINNQDNWQQNLISTTDKAAREKNQSRTSSRILLSLFISGAVFLLVASGFSFLYDNQQQLLNQKIKNLGQTLISVIASESSESLLSEDWIAIELFTEELSKRHELAYISIIDRNGLVRGHINPLDIGKKSLKPDIEGKITNDDFLFVTPVLFGDKSVGRLIIGLSPDVFSSDQTNTIITMSSFTIIISIFVAIATFFVTGRFAFTISNRKNTLNYIPAALQQLSLHKKTEITDHKQDYLEDTINPGISNTLRAEEETLIKD